MTMALTQVSDNGLTNTGVTAATYGSSSAIPSKRSTPKARSIAASTNNITQVGGSNAVDFNDNVKARFGNGNDLEIYHNGTNSYVIEQGTGELILALTDWSELHSTTAKLVRRSLQMAVASFITTTA